MLNLRWNSTDRTQKLPRPSEDRQETFGNSPYCGWNANRIRRCLGDDATMPNARDPGMLERLERVETKIDRLGGKVESVEAKVDRMESRLGGMDTRLARLEVQFERLGDDFRTLAGNVGGKFDAILREFAEARKDSSVRFTDHENVMKDHGRRISALERDRRQ